MFGHGRGGRGYTSRSNRFVFCLFDWVSSRRTIDGGLVSRRDIMAEYNENAPTRIMNEAWLAFVYTYAVRLEGDRRAQYLLRHVQEQQQLALVRQDCLVEGDDRVNE